MRWFKFYGQDWLTDMKIMSMSMEDRLCYITLLALASSADNNGTIKACNEDALIRLANIPKDLFNDTNPYDNARGCLKRYEALQCVTLHDNGDVTINNFERRQSEFLSNAERQKNYRERQKTANNKVKKNISRRNDSNVTQRNDSNARIEENRIDKNIYTQRDSNQLFFEQGQEYETLLVTFSEGKDANFIRKEFEKFLLYWTEPNKSGTKQRWELQQTFDVKRRLVTWLSNKTNNYSKPQGRGLAQ